MGRYSGGIRHYLSTGINLVERVLDSKPGYYPTKIEKIASITTFEEETKESEALHLEFVEFIKQRLKK